MYYNKHFSGPANQRENNQMKLRPGQFSNHGSINTHHERDSNNRSKSPSPFHYDQNKNYRGPNSNGSFEGLSRIQTHITTDNEQYHPLFEQVQAEHQQEQYFNNYESVSSNPQSDKGVLISRNPNVHSKNPSRNQSVEKSKPKNVNETSQPKIRKNLSNSHLQKSAGNSGQKYASKTNGFSNQKGSATQMSYGKLPRYQPENDENYDFNGQQNSLTASRSSSYLKSNEKKKQIQPQIIQPIQPVQQSIQQNQMIFDNSFSHDLSIINEDLERTRKENIEMRNALNLLHDELQGERNKNESLENELSSLTNNITEERAKYQGELMKISMQIKKLRNIQNIYVNEKKNSERLEAELNEKNKMFEQVSCYSADCVRSMLLTLEFLLIKGDVNYEKQEFNPSDYYRLIYEIRKNLLPSVELAESYSIPNEWKTSDYQQIITHTKEIMKYRKSNNFFSESKTILSQYGSNDRKNLCALSTQYSSKQTSSRSHLMPINTCSTSMTPQNQNFTTFSNTPSETSKRAFFENQNQTNLTYSTKTTEPRGVKSNSEYVPFNSRVNLIEHLSNRDDFDEIVKENDHFFASPQASPKKEEKRPLSEKNSLDNEAISENIGGQSLGSTILPRTNNCSGFNETFENLMTDKLQEERRLSEITISNSYVSKNYDLPLSSFNNGYGQNSLKQLENEAGKNKNFKKKPDNDTRKLEMDSIKPPSNSVTYLKEQSADGIQVTMGELESEDHPNHDYFTSDPPQKPTEECYPISNGYIFSPKAELDKYREYDLPKQDTRASDYSSNNQESPQNKETPFIHHSHSKKVSSSLANSTQKQQTSAHQFSLQASPVQTNTHIYREDNSPNVMRKDTASDSRSSFSETSTQQVLAKYEYRAQKDNDLEFKKGDRIQVLKRTENGWWIGMCNNKIGYFPYNFVTMTE